MNLHELLLNKIQLDEYVDCLTDEYDFSIRYNFICDAIEEINDTGALGNRIEIQYNPGEKSNSALFDFLNRLERAKYIYQELKKYGLDDSTELAKELYDYANILIYNKKYKNVYELLDAASNLKNDESQILLGKMLAYGLYDTKRSITAALEYFMKAADNDNALAAYEIVKLYDYDNDFVAPEMAKDYCEKAAALGSEKAAERLNSPFDYEPKKKMIEARIQAGDPKAIIDMVNYLYDKEDEGYVEYLEEGVDNKNVYCLLFKAKLLYQQKLKDEANELLQECIDSNFYEAYKFYADINTDTNFYSFETNRGQAPTTTHIVQYDLYREAYLNGIEECKIYVAKAYYFGYPVYVDKPKAFLLFKELSNNGNYEAMYYLAKMYENADTVEMDMNLAVKLLTDSADHGNIEAMEELIKIYSIDEDYINPKLVERYKELVQI
jgi:TPR repeat protein